MDIFDDNEFLTALRDDTIATVIGYYTDCLSGHEKAKAFLIDHYGLNLQQAQQLRIGVSDRSLAKRLPKADCQGGKQLRHWLKEQGIYKSSGHEALRGCVTFPLYDADGKITGIEGHRIDPKAKQTEPIVIGTGQRDRSIKAGIDETVEPETRQEPQAAKEQEAIVDPAETPTVTPKVPSEPDDELIVEEHQVIYVRDDRRYRIRGLEKNTSAYALKVNLMVSRDDLVHVDTLDLARARSRASFIKAAASELFVDADLIKRDVGTLLMKLESLREQQIEDAKQSVARPIELSAKDHSEAIALLRSPDLLGRIVADMDACGMVGESTNKLAGYLAATSRKLADPLAIVIQSSSSAGKTSLMDAILGMMPEEDVNRFSGMTGQSLFYLDSDQVKHKVLAISEDEGIAQATYALKLLVTGLFDVGFLAEL